MLNSYKKKIFINIMNFNLDKAFKEHQRLSKTIY